MTIAEAKVKEFANKLLELIKRSENEEISPINSVKHYLLGVVDGLDFSKEMNDIGTADNRATTDEAERSDGKL